MQNQNPASAVLLISCPDRTGLVNAVTGFILQHHGNVLYLDQHVDMEQNVFFMRIEWAEQGFGLKREAIPAAFRPLAEQFRMQWTLHFSDVIPRMAVFVSKQSHCLFDILGRFEAGDWPVQIPLIVSNHPDLGPLVRNFGIRFEYLPITPETKAAQERRALELLREQQVDLIVLARYMQILSPVLIDANPNRIINIHHSFLPAFAGAKPYHAAYARGVKIIGATSHYVTADLDQGPIIAQDIIRVSHKDAVEELIRKGKDLEKIVLARAVWWHLQHKLLVHGNKTVVFD